MAKEAVKIQEGSTFDYVATGIVANGDVLEFDARIGVAYDDAVADDTIAVAIEGVFEIVAVTADAITQGQALYFITATRDVTTTVGTNTPCGMAVSAKAGATAGSVSVKIG